MPYPYGAGGQRPEQVDLAVSGSMEKPRAPRANVQRHLQAIKQLLHRGDSVVEIATQIGCSTDSIYKIKRDLKRAAEFKP